MTRFARAKGSKSSNEKVPEDATPWSQLKKRMPIKQETLSEKTKKCVTALKSKIQEEKHIEWVSFDDENDDCLNVLKKHLQGRKKIHTNVKNDCDSNEQGMKIKKKKKREESVEESKAENLECQMKKKKKKLENKDQEKSLVAHKNIKKKQVNKENAGEWVVEEVKSCNPKIIQIKKLNTEDNVISGKNKKKKRKRKDVSQTADWLETNEEEFNGKTLKKRKKLDEKSVSDVEDTVQKMGKFLKKKKMKSFAGEKSLKNNSNTFSIKSQLNTTQKLKNSKSDKEKVSPDKLANNIGGEMDIVKYQGFYIKKEDSERLKELSKKMKKEGIPQDQIAGAIKLERRRCEKALARMKKNVCFHCRKPGHLLSQCPELQDNLETSTGVCYKCGSTEHKAFTCRVTQEKAYPFAECFICKEKGHIARECPDNPRGLYPKGGCCKICGDVTHLKKDCPQRISEAEEKNITLSLRDDRNVEGLDDFNSLSVEQKDRNKLKEKVVRF